MHLPYLPHSDKPVWMKKALWLWPEQALQLNASVETEHIPSSSPSGSGRQPLSSLRPATSMGEEVGERSIEFIQRMNRKFDKATSVTKLSTRGRLSFRLMEEGVERFPGRPECRDGE